MTTTTAFAGGDQAQPPALPVLSGGSFCLAADIIKRHGFRSGAGPFDWLFCSVRDLIAIIGDDFQQFLQSAHYQSISARTGRPSCMHALYGGWNVERPLFNHKDPTTDEDHRYYRAAVERFRSLAASGAALFVVEERGEIEALFDELRRVVDARFPRLALRALRLRPNDMPATMTLLRTEGRHELWRADCSPARGGVTLENAADEMLIVDTMFDRHGR